MTQAQWFERFTTWVPPWMLTQSAHVTPVLQAMAKVMADHDAERADLIEQTFIREAEGSFLDTHGAERATPRTLNEVDPAYAKRVQSKHIISQADPVSLKTLVDSVLLRGESTIFEDGGHAPFFEPNLFFGDTIIQDSSIKDAFTVLIDKQTYPTYSFFEDGMFFESGVFAGSVESDANVLSNVIRIVNENRAFGAPFRLVEKSI